MRTDKIEPILYSIGAVKVPILVELVMNDDELNNMKKAGINITESDVDSKYLVVPALIHLNDITSIQKYIFSPESEEKIRETGYNPKDCVRITSDSSPSINNIIIMQSYEFFVDMLYLKGIESSHTFWK
jgi:hypothetical protein